VLQGQSVILILLENFHILKRRFHHASSSLDSVFTIKFPPEVKD